MRVLTAGFGDYLKQGKEEEISGFPVGLKRVLDRIQLSPLPLRPGRDEGWLQAPTSASNRATQLYQLANGASKKESV